MESHNILKFYNKSTGDLIGYLLSTFDLTNDITRSMKFVTETNLDIIADTLILRTYKKDWVKGSMSKHEYGHLYEDKFKDIKKEDVSYKILNYELEIRRLKIESITRKKG